MATTCRLADIVVGSDVAMRRNLPTPALPGQVQSVGGPAIRSIGTPPSQPAIRCELPMCIWLVHTSSQGSTSRHLSGPLLELVTKNDSAIALSQHCPTLPIEARRPSSFKWAAN